METERSTRLGYVLDDDDDYSVDGLAWKSDGTFRSLPLLSPLELTVLIGHMLAVAISNGTVLLIDSFSGKSAHHLRVAPEKSVDIPNWSSSQSSPKSCKVSSKPRSNVSWSTHFVSATSTRAQLQATTSDVVLDDLLGLNTDISKLLEAKANLPRQLAQLDIETSLPKLSTLPATGKDDDVFSTRASVDTIFHPQSSTAPQRKASGDTVDVLTARTRDCLMHLRIFDSFEIGNVDASQALPKGLEGRRIVQHASNPLLSSRYFVIEAERDGHTPRAGSNTKEEASLHVVGLDLRFISQSSYNLPLVATKATQLQNLLRYISQIQTQLSQEVRTAFDLPSRFLRNVNESLAEQDSSASFSTAAYDLVVTGEIQPRLKEWLVDEVGERGLKRWEKAVGDCLDLIRRMMSECLLPAIERCQVVVSRLDGLSRFSDTANRLGLDEKGIRSVRDTLDVLTILCEDLLQNVCVEVREFAAFMRWLKWEAEVEGLEEGSERAEEMRESYNGEAELRMVLDYISGAMQKSRVTEYIDISKDAAEGKQTDGLDESQFYVSYKKGRKEDSRKVQLPKLGDVVQLLKDRSQEVFKGIADTLRKNILSSYVAELDEDADTSVMDCRVTQSEAAEGAYEVCIMARSKSRAEEMMISTSKGDSVRGTKAAAMEKQKVVAKGEIMDFKFTDAGGFIALVKSGNDRQLSWRAIDGMEWETRFHFPSGNMSGGMRPSRLEVNSRKGRRTVAVLDEAGMGFVVLSLDT